MKHMIKQKAAFFAEWTRAWWLRFMLFVSGFKGHELKPVTKIEEIPERLGWGQHWHKDPGRADKWYHPKLTQRRIDEGRAGYGDCDDHATYWCALLLKGGLAADVSIGFIRYIDHTGVEAGHYVTLFRDAEGTPYWADYKLPEKVDPDISWRWAVQVVQSGYGTRLVKAARYSVTLGKNDTPHIKLEALELF